MANNIVTVNVSVTNAPAPNTLQQTGALVSVGATSLTAGTRGLLTQLSDLTPMLAGALTLTGLAWSSGTVTATTSAAIGLTVGDTFRATISGTTPAGYSQTNVVVTVTGANTFTYGVASNPGTATFFGAYTYEDVAELVAMATTFFAQPNPISVYVLELGPGGGADGVTALGAWITNNPKTVYSFLVPRFFASTGSGLLPLITQYAGPTSLTKFFATATLTGPTAYTGFTNLMANAFVMIEAPAIPVTEFTCAAPFQATLRYAPSATNKVTPLAYEYLYGVTPYPVVGNSALFSTLLTAYVNFVGTGAEGGITTAILRNGTMMDGNPFNHGYSIDWAQIQLDLALANAVINGSNNPQAPLYYNQGGINQLQAVAQQTLTNGVTFGLFLGPVSVTATPFYTYTQQNPGNYAIGLYGGLAASVTGQNGFTNIVFNMNVSNFVINPGP